MPLAELAARVNCAEYKNWLKPGHSRHLWKVALQRFADEQIHVFHRQFIASDSAHLIPSGFRCGEHYIPRDKQVRLPNADPELWPSQERMTSRYMASAESIAPSLRNHTSLHSRITQAYIQMQVMICIQRVVYIGISFALPFQPSCSLCKEWKKEIFEPYTRKMREIYWGNCRSWFWPSNSWELAQAYMPCGKGNTYGPDKCDASALLNLFIFCDHFNNIDPKKIRVVSNNEIKCHNELMHSADMKVCFSWLKEFGNHVQNLLTEFYQVPEAQTACHRIEKDLNRLQIVRNFLLDNHELQSNLRTEMQNLEDLVKE
ncbi:LOW QUALITY PROTEIN: uncharacterized protein CXorf38 homolog [Ahaetulla prasina]|uniref:LOW QUALITY PROTEIN: uncharacterized protein CXorf38 homolog n=1 Tax=Ahaetulla prasina TaxID=499056 RepID=UPI0026493799|nr:LOW QUALITY PROTEIN: uncharacterized protein CXorf38 homolog [Ahaetulla prasina]